MNIDAFSSLAFSIYSNKGVYALFLGAGISKSVGIPTGWDIVKEQLTRLAAQNGEQDIPDIERWFEDKYGKPASYSSVLGECVSTSSERVGLLKPYFEKDTSGNGYEPSLAHKRIAKLVKRGFIRVILTTNFDKLLENALTAEGVVPQIISNVSDISGAIPLVHDTITVIKINGDYLDCRFKNTEEELSTYPQEFKDYLSFIFNNFGIITCGWSAQWDQGIKEILFSSENRRYSSFFTYVHSCTQQLEELATARSGKTICIESADVFFNELDERISALERLEGSHPLSKDIAIARAKKYLSVPLDYISLNDILESETKRAKKIINSNIDINSEMSSDNFMENIRLGYKASETIIAIATEIAHWSKDSTVINILCESLERLAQMPNNGSCTYRTDAIYSYKFSYFIPYYAVCFAAIRYENFQLLWALARIKIPKFPSGEKQLLLEALHSDDFGSKDSLNKLLSTSYKTPQSTIIHKLLSEYTTAICFNEKEERIVFDKMEYILSILYGAIVKDRFSFWVPSGEFVWSETRYRNSEFQDFFESADKMKNEWPPIKAGMFDGQYEMYAKAKSDADEFHKKYRFY